MRLCHKQRFIGGSATPQMVDKLAHILIDLFGQTVSRRRVLLRHVYSLRQILPAHMIAHWPISGNCAGAFN
jgi:hypothetical protein